jgi:hypothetical protein
MLQYMGTRQPPRPYPKCEENTNHFCTECQTTLWTSELLNKFKSSSTSGQASFLYTYVDSAEHIRRAAIEGCPWCRGLANGIHGRAYLDSVYDAWAQGSQDDEEHSDDEEQDGDLDAPDSVPLGADSGSSMADDHDPAGIWDLETDHDTLAYPCRFKITLSFESNSEGIYAFLNIRIESIDLDQEHLLSKVTGERAVDLRYYLQDTCSKMSTMVDPSPQGSSDSGKSAPTSPLSVEQSELSILGSDVNFSRTIAWLEKAERPKSTGAQSPEASSAKRNPPSRLICVESKSTIRVVETTTLKSKDIRYTCLSYVWGKNQNFQLLRSNMASLMKGFEYSELPKTIQDAVTVTRRLNYSYLWVDAL